jgi:hypothetical protein
VFEEVAVRGERLAQLESYAGVEWWVERHDSQAKVPLQQYRDDATFETAGYQTHPLFHCEYFLESFGGPTLALHQYSPDNGKNHYPLRAEDGHIVSPRENNFAVFQVGLRCRARVYVCACVFVSVFRFATPLSVIVLLLSARTRLARSRSLSTLPLINVLQGDLMFGMFAHNKKRKDHGDQPRLVLHLNYWPYRPPSTYVQGLPDGDTPIDGVTYYSKRDMRTLRKSIDNLRAVHPTTGLSQSLRTLTSIDTRDVTKKSTLHTVKVPVVYPNGDTANVSVPKHLRQGALYKLSFITGKRSPLWAPRKFKKYLKRERKRFGIPKVAAEAKDESKDEL